MPIRTGRHRRTRRRRERNSTAWVRRKGRRAAIGVHAAAEKGIQQPESAGKAEGSGEQPAAAKAAAGAAAGIARARSGVE